MKILHLPAVIILALGIFLSGCGLASENKDATTVADQFYSALQKGDLGGAAALCATDEVLTTDGWKELLYNNLNSVGDIKSFEKSGGFNVSIENGISTVKLAYTIEYAFGKSFDSLELSNNGTGFKIGKYSPQLLEARFREELDKSVGIVRTYMTALSAADHNTALQQIGYSGIEKHNSEEWIALYAMLNAENGKIASFTIDPSQAVAYINTEHKEAGEGNVYSVKVVSIRNGKSYAEQVDLYQPKFGDPLHIVAHSVDM